MMADELLTEQLEKMARSRIEDLKRQLVEAESILHDLLIRKRSAGANGMRFFDWSPIDAIRELIKENGGKMKRSELVEKMIAGGVSIQRKRPMVNIDRSFVTNIKNGNLIEDGDYIDIPR